MPRIILGEDVVLKSHPGIRWTVSFVEGNKIYCYNIEQNHRASIVVDVSLIDHYIAGDAKVG